MRTLNRFRDTTRRVLLAATLTCSAAGAQAQIMFRQQADLTLSVTATPSPVPAQDLFTYTISVQNTAVMGKTCNYDPVTMRFFCSQVPISANASAVTVNTTLPPGVQFISPSADSGFACAATSSSTVSCTNGAILAGATALIRLTVRAPSAQGNITAAFAVSSPFVDRDPTNNSATLTIAVGPPNPNKPDLWANGTATPNPFKAWEAVRFDVFIHNSGPAPASNVTFRFYTNLPAGLAALSVNSGFSCRGLSGFGQALEVECTGGNIAAWSSGFMSVQVRLANSLTPVGTPLTLYGHLDTAQTNDELNENNNGFTLVSIVSP